MNGFIKENRSREDRTGFALILVLVVVAMLALSTYTFSSLMVTENESVILHGRQLQARALVDSGAAHARYLLELDPITRESLGGLYDNPQLFQAQLVVNNVNGRQRGRFGVVAPLLDDQGYFAGVRFGLQDESSRLNVNALNLEVAGEALAAATGGDVVQGARADEDATPGGDPGGGSDEESRDDEESNEDESGPTDTSAQAMLMKLPGMTIDVADSILDWIDEDDQPRENGAELDYYSSLTPGYTPRNGPIETIEELLLVRGVTPDLLFGRDINRNGMVDIQERQLPLMIEYDPGDGSMDLGWAAYLTLYSQEKNVTSDGEPRIDLNQDDMQTLYDELAGVMDPTWANFIVAYRQYGPYDGRGDGENTVEASALDVDLTSPGRTSLSQVLDLIAVKIQIEGEGEDGDGLIVESPFPENPVAMSVYLPALMDFCTVNTEPTIPGRININRAPRTVLLAIPRMTSEIADQILSQRDLANSEIQEDLQQETWLLTRAIVTLDEMREMLPFVTAGGDVYRAQIVGYFDRGEIAARTEVLLDGTSAYPRILLWRDISHLGRGYARELLGVEIDAMGM